MRRWLGALLGVALAGLVTLNVLLSAQGDTADAHVARAKAAAGETYQNLFTFLCAAPPARGGGVRGGAPGAPRAGGPPRGGGPGRGGAPAVPDRSTWYADPVKVFDNLYFVGQSEYSAWAITTSDGIILIDTLFDYSVEEEVAGGLKKLGLDPARIRYAVVTHPHPDHHGGARFLQERFGTRIVMSAADWDTLDRTTGTRPARDMVATDGQSLTLGDTTVTLYVTPGHTPGTLSATFTVRDANSRHTAALWGGNGLNADRESLELYIRSAQRFDEIVQKAVGGRLPVQSHRLGWLQGEAAPHGRPHTRLSTPVRRRHRRRTTVSGGGTGVRDGTGPSVELTPGAPSNCARQARRRQARIDARHRWTHDAHQTRREDHRGARDGRGIDARLTLRHCAGLRRGPQWCEAAGCQRHPDGDWPTYNRDLAGTRYSPLTQIDTGNVATLREAWSYRLRPAPGVAVPAIDKPASSFEMFQQVTPIVVNGVMYLPSGNRVVALEPDTGKEIWRYELPEGLASFRGVAYWPGDGNVPRAHLLHEPATPVRAQGRHRSARYRLRQRWPHRLEIAYSGVPAIYRNVVLMGSNFFGPGERHIGPHLTTNKGEKGDVHAYDARTGKKLWDFHTIPLPGETGNETWLNDSWKDRTGNNVWSFTLTVDEQRGLVYMPVSGPGMNYYGGDRPGNNLFSNSTVALDAQTGTLRWHFQNIRHEIWDYNLPPAPGLIDIRRDGKTIPALAQVGKSGFMFILNRETGAPVYGVDERPMAKADVPGEWYPETQPIPKKPGPLARVSMSRDDLVTASDTTPAHAEACRALWERVQFRNDGPYTPWNYRPNGGPPSVVFPGVTGGVNWGGTATDPSLGYIFVNSKDEPTTGWIAPNPRYNEQTKDTEFPYVQQNGGALSAEARDASGRSLGTLPCFRPPWASLMAIDAATGEFAWRVPLGVNDEHARWAAERRLSRLRRSDRDRRRPGVHRRHPRQALPRLRLEDGQGAVGHALRLRRHRDSHQLPGAERQAVHRGDGGDEWQGEHGSAAGLLASVTVLNGALRSLRAPSVPELQERSSTAAAGHIPSPILRQRFPAGRATPSALRRLARCSARLPLRPDRRPRRRRRGRCRRGESHSRTARTVRPSCRACNHRGRRSAGFGSRREPLRPGHALSDRASPSCAPLPCR